MSDYELLKPQKVWNFFKQINDIPRGSGNEKAVSDYFVQFAKKRNLWVHQDESFNIIIKKDGTKGYENSPAVTIQGHMDMVCEKVKESTHDFMKDPIKMLVKGDMVTADGTTLGADDGIAAAMGLAILDSDNIAHPPIELVLTTDEESGMGGARNLDTSLLQGRRLINIDSEEEGHILTCCAGGMRAKITLPLQKQPADETFSAFKIIISGLKGGHSGSDIHLQRASANKLMGRVLNTALNELGGFLAEVNGGNMDNAITRDAEAIVLVRDGEKLAEELKKFENIFRNEYKNVDDSIIVSSEKINAPKEVMTAETGRKAVSVLMLIPFGVETMSMEIKGLVESSSNIGIVRTNENEITFDSAVRSSVNSRKWLICDKMQAIADLCGGKFEWRNEYPAWEYKENSPLRNILSETYEKMFWQKPHIDAIHAGLECGLFCGKMPDCDMVSIGPEMANVHTPDEVISVSSVERTYNYLLAVLKNLK